MNRRILVTFIALLLLANQLQGKSSLISKSRAIEIALNYGLKVGLSEYSAELRSDSTWVISSLLSDDVPDRTYDTKAINALTGKIIMNIYFARMVSQTMIGGRIYRTIVNTDIDFDSLPIAKYVFDRKLTKLNECESNPVFSDNDKRIVFQYGLQKIGMINTDGTDFKEIDHDCLYPQWLNDEWVAYFKDSEHIYKKNIHSNTQIRITSTPNQYDKFLISPDKQWILYQSSEMWPTLDSLGNQIMYMNTGNGEGQNLCIMSMDGKVKKFLKKDWTCYSNPYWTKNSDSILFNISDYKYCATNLNDHEIDYSRFDLLDSISLEDYGKVIGNTFPLVYGGQIFEIDRNSLKPIRVLVEKYGRYKEAFFSHNKEYLIYAKTDKKDGVYQIWIKKLISSRSQNNPYLKKT